MRHPSADSPQIDATEIDPERICAAVAKRLEAGPLNLLPAAAITPLSYMGGGFADEPPPPYVLSEDGIATISISGILLREAWDWWGYEICAGYDRIVERVSAAAHAYDVAAIMLAIDSPGGVSVGNVEAAEEIRALADESGKPLAALCTQACSAAYALASAADEILVIPSGMLGCIGTIASRLDVSGAMEMAGLREIVAAYPPGKAIQSNTGAAPSAVREYMMKQVRPLADLLMGFTAERRGVDVEAIFKLDAVTLIGAEAVAARLGDAVVSERGAYEAIRRRMTPRKGYSMGNQQSAAHNAAETILSALISAVGLDPAKSSELTLEQVNAAVKVTREQAAFGASVVGIVSAAMKGACQPAQGSVNGEQIQATHAEALAAVELWKRQATEALPAVRAKLAARTAQLAVSTGRMTPAQAYAEGQDPSAREFPALPTLAPRIASMSLEALELEINAAAPLPATMAAPAAKRKPASPLSVTEADARRAGFTGPNAVTEYTTYIARYGAGVENDE